MLSIEFMIWLEGYLDNVPDGFDLNKEKTQKIKDKLNSVFKHEIDPQMDKGRNPKELRQTHDGTLGPLFDSEDKDMC